jgi:hypothetical protein
MGASGIVKTPLHSNAMSGGLFNNTIGTTPIIFSAALKDTDSK